jgi:hypothetical protein
MFESLLSNDSNKQNSSNFYDESVYFKTDIPDITPNNFLSNRNKSRHYICRKCNTFPKIFFLSQNKINLKCKCGNKNIEEFMTDLVDLDNNEINYYNIICNEHNQNFSYFCQNCNKNICKLCQVNCSIKKHKIIDIDDDKPLLNKVIQFKNKIEQRLKTKSSNDFDIDINFDENDRETKSYLLKKDESGNLNKILKNNNEREK